MRTLGTLLLGWLVTGCCAAAGSILGNAFGKRGLQAGAVLGGVAGVLLATALARRLGWIEPGQLKGARIGGVIGFAIAVPLTLLNMGSPVVPVASCGLVGIGILAGARSGRPGSDT